MLIDNLRTAFPKKSYTDPPSMECPTNCGRHCDPRRLDSPNANKVESPWLNGTRTNVTHELLYGKESHHLAARSDGDAYKCGRCMCFPEKVHTWVEIPTKGSVVILSTDTKDTRPQVQLNVGYEINQSHNCGIDKSGLINFVFDIASDLLPFLEITEQAAKTATNAIKGTKDMTGLLKFGINGSC